MKKIYIILLMIGLISLQTFAQISVRGKVIDNTNEPIIGATVSIKGATIGTITDINGNYTIKTEEGSTLLFSFLGYEKVEKKVDSSTINVTMLVEETEFDEVVVIGYGAVRKSDLTGAVSSLRGNDLNQFAPLSIDQGMQGRIAGVLVQPTDGTPGGGMSIQIRGANSFSGGTEPLYVVDDIPFESSSTPGSTGGDLSTTNPLSTINPNDIESIEILKDASATAIYGSRGANGVVLIRTKSGMAGQTKIDVNINQGWSAISKKIDVLSAQAYSKLFNEARINADLYDVDAGYLTNNNMKYFDVFNTKGTSIKGPGYYRDHSSDWQDMIFQTGSLTDATASISGGSDKMTYMVSANFADQDGIIKSSSFSRAGLRVNLQGKISEILSFGINTNFSVTDNRFVKTGSNVGQAGGVVRSALRYPPVYSPTTPDGLIADEWYDASNPLTYVTSQKNQVDDLKNVFSGFLEAKVTKDLKFRTRLGGNWSRTERSQYLPAGTRESKGGKAYYRENISSKLVNENLLTYNKIFNKIHSLNAVVAGTWEINKSTNRTNEASGFLNDYLQDDAMQTANETPIINNGRAKSTMASWLGRVNYTLNNKYLFTVSYRADGSSKFAQNNKWAYFPSGAVAWRASEEGFIKDLNIFSNLKIRASYGETGNQAISTYGSMTRMGAVKYANDGQLVTGVGINPDGLGNNNLTWETTKQTDLGIDLGFFNNRLNLIVDVYRKSTHDLLQQQEIPLSLGYTKRWINMGELRNEGLEITLSGTPVAGRFTWNSDFNISFNRNKVISLGDGIPSQTVNRVATDVEPFMLVAGRPLGEIYAYKTQGVYQNEQEVIDHGLYANDPTMVKFMVGEYKYLNASNVDNQPDGDFVLNSEDRVVVGNSNPDFIFGFSNSFSYKGFDMSLLLQGMVGNDIVNTTSWSMESNIGGSSSNITWEAYNNLWRGEGTSNEYPKAIESKKRLVIFSDKYIENGSYLKLKNITLGYTFKFRKSFIQGLRLAGNVTNVFTITSYSGFDPEVNAFNSDPTRRGVDMGNYPANRTYSLNLSATF